jgi:transposase InsO family protein
VSPNRIPAVVEDRIVELRKELTDLGLDAGGETIRWHLQHDDPPPKPVPSASTIWRVLVRRGFVTPDRNRRARRRWRSFAADRANECWQMDSMDYQLADGTTVKIINIIDDCSRLLAINRAEPRCTTDTSWNALHDAALTLGWPARLLRDNAREFAAHTDRLHALGIQSRHSRPYHPQTCGKVERFQHTQRKFLDAHGPYDTTEALQGALGVPPLWRTPTVCG